MGSRGQKILAMVREEREERNELCFETSISDMNIILADDVESQMFHTLTEPEIFEQPHPIPNCTPVKVTSSELQMEISDPVTTTILELQPVQNVVGCESDVKIIHAWDTDGNTLVIRKNCNVIDFSTPELIKELPHNTDSSQRGLNINEFDANIVDIRPVQNLMTGCNNYMEVAQMTSINDTSVIRQEHDLHSCTNLQISETSTNIKDCKPEIPQNNKSVLNSERNEDGDKENESGPSTKKKQLRKDKVSASKHRVLGKTYIGYRKVDNSIQQDVSRESRKLKQRCGHTYEKKKSDRSFLCGAISENKRQDLFKYFWKLPSWPEKKMYVKGLVSTRNIRKRRSGKITGKKISGNMSVEETADEEHRSKKMEGHDIFLPKENGEKVRVCRSFFLNTFCLGEDTFKRWVKKERDEDEDEDENNDDEVKAHQPPRRIKKCEDEKSVKMWLDLLPKVPSHYCRQSSKRIYVESVFYSKAHMHREYKKWCTEKQINPASITLLKQVMKNENISIHRPRKDQCDICSSYKLGHVQSEVYQAHVKQKTEAREEKNAAKASAMANTDHLAITMDLQSVLLCPKTLQSAMYYKTKLQVHNFTVYNLGNKDVTLYVWHEGNGGVTANEFTSCILDYLSRVKDKYRIVTLISDGCGYQNRNRVLSSALRDFAAQYNVIIEQIILTKGHTMMEADSVHSTLEQLFHPPINSPSDYVARMRLARPTQPYEVKVVEFDFFKNYEALTTNLASLRPGKSVGDPVVNDVCKLKYSPDGVISYKTQFKENWLELPQRPRCSFSNKGSLAQLYDKPLPISESKFKDLQNLKSAIEKDHHPFYDSLSFKSDKKSKGKKLLSETSEQAPEFEQRRGVMKQKNVLANQTAQKKSIKNEKPQIQKNSKKNKK